MYLYITGSSSLAYSSVYYMFTIKTKQKSFHCNFTSAAFLNIIRCLDVPVHLGDLTTPTTHYSPIPAPCSEQTESDSTKYSNKQNQKAEHKVQTPNIITGSILAGSACQASQSNY